MILLSQKKISSNVLIEKIMPQAFLYSFSLSCIKNAAEAADAITKQTYIIVCCFDKVALAKGSVKAILIDATVAISVHDL